MSATVVQSHNWEKRENVCDVPSSEQPRCLAVCCKRLRFEAVSCQPVLWGCQSLFLFSLLLLLRPQVLAPGCPYSSTMVHSFFIFQFCCQAPNWCQQEFQIQLEITFYFNFGRVVCWEAFIHTRLSLTACLWLLCISSLPLGSSPHSSDSKQQRLHTTDTTSGKIYALFHIYNFCSNLSI